MKKRERTRVLIEAIFNTRQEAREQRDIHMINVDMQPRSSRSLRAYQIAEL